MYFDNPRFDKVVIEVTNSCNFKCWCCPYEAMTRKKGRMSLANFKGLIDSFDKLKNLSLISIGGYGEPTLHPQLIDMITYAKSKKRYTVHTTTNGSKFINNDFSLALLKTEIDEITISLRITEYEKHKSNFPKNFNYQQYIDSILNIISLKYKHGFNTKIQIALFKESFYSKYFIRKSTKEYINNDVINTLFKAISTIIGKNVPSFEDMCRPIRTKASNLSLVHIDKGLTIELDSLSHVTSFEEKYRNKEKCFLAKYGSCMGLLNHFGIWWAGEVSPCCADYDAKNVLGNVFEEKDITKILSNKKSVYFNNSLRRNKMPSYSCQICRGGMTRLEKWGNFMMIFYNKLSFN
jgi:radical SAM protein with 4Fe4S-binding SPASM domain